MTLTRFGLQLPSFAFDSVADSDLFDTICAIATTAERSGFDSLWVMDHFHQIPTIGPAEEPMLEAYTLLAGLAARTRTARLGTLVTGVTYRNPALLAKTVTTLDVVSSGRAILGIGAAWFESEHLAYGYRFPPVGERMDRLEDAVRICRAMFTDHSGSRGTTFTGSRHHTASALNLPLPVTAGGPPILVGGGGERRTLKITARYADACNIFGDPPAIAQKLSVLHAHCDRAGRDPSEISNTRLGSLIIADTTSDAERIGAEMRAKRNMSMEKYRGYVVAGDRDSVLEQIAALFDAGLDGLIFNFADPTDLAGIAETGALLTDNFGSR